MNHLSYPDDHVHPRDEVPLLCDQSLFSNRPSDFGKWPVTCGWATEDSPHAWMICSSSLLAARSQEWLYFGLLAEFVNGDVDIARWSSSSLREGTRQVDSFRIAWDVTSYLWETVKDGWTARVDIRHRQKTLAFDACRIAAFHVNLIDRYVEDFDDTLQIVVCSIKILLDLLLNANYDFCSSIPSNQKEGAGEALWRERTTQKSDSWLVAGGGLKALVRDDKCTKLVRRRLAHWCPFQVRRFESQFSTSTMYLLSAIPNAGTAGRAHRGCSQKSCIANNVNMARYETVHTDPCRDGSEAQCQFLGFETDRLAAIIDRGYIPLVSGSISDEGVIHLEMVASKAGTNYFAISHVWSGGLGNFKENRLPSCQLQDILRSIAALNIPMEKRGSVFYNIGDAAIRRSSRRPRTFLFWMDTLCVPVGHAYASQRTQSIENMPQIYSCARQVLVLDPALRKISRFVEKDITIKAQLICSNWMARCWTLHEAVLAKNFSVLFRDGFLHYYDRNSYGLIGRSVKPLYVEGSTPPDECDLYLRSVGSQRSYGKCLEPRNGSEAINLSQSLAWANLVHAWNSMSGRITSMPEDVRSIIALTLGLSPAEIRHLQPDMQMKAMLKAQPSLPSALLFVDIERLPSEKYSDRWVPNSIWNQSLDQCYGLMELTEEGLLFNAGYEERDLIDYERIERRIFLIDGNLSNNDSLLLLLNENEGLEVLVDLLPPKLSPSRGADNSPLLLVLNELVSSAEVESSVRTFLPSGCCLRLRSAPGMNISLSRPDRAMQPGHTTKQTELPIPTTIIPEAIVSAYNFPVTIDADYECPVRIQPFINKFLQQDPPEEVLGRTIVQGRLVPQGNHLCVRSDVHRWYTPRCRFTRGKVSRLLRVCSYIFIGTTWTCVVLLVAFLGPLDTNGGSFVSARRRDILIAVFLRLGPLIAKCFIAGEKEMVLDMQESEQWQHVISHWDGVNEIRTLQDVSPFIRLLAPQFGDTAVLAVLLGVVGIVCGIFAPKARVLLLFGVAMIVEVAIRYSAKIWMKVRSGQSGSGRYWFDCFGRSQRKRARKDTTEAAARP